MVDDIVVGAGGLGFDFQFVQVKHCVVNSLPLYGHVASKQSCLVLSHVKAPLHSLCFDEQYTLRKKEYIGIKVAFQTKNTFLLFYKQQKNRT